MAVTLDLSRHGDNNIHMDCSESSGEDENNFINIMFTTVSMNGQG